MCVRRQSFQPRIAPITKIGERTRPTLAVRSVELVVLVVVGQRPGSDRCEGGAANAEGAAEVGAVTRCGVGELEHEVGRVRSSGGAIGFGVGDA